MIFDKEETKNILNMLRSPDKENAIIAFESLKNVDIKKYIGELILLYKFGKQTNDIWEANCPKCFTAICKEIDINKTLSTGECLSAMTFNKVSMHSIELFMELFTENMVGFLGQMGYPIDKFDIILKLKDGQGTES